MAFKTLQELQQYGNPFRRHSDLSSCIRILNKATAYRSYLRVSRSRMSQCWPEVRVPTEVQFGRSLPRFLSVLQQTSDLVPKFQSSNVSSKFNSTTVTAKLLTTCCVLTTAQFPPCYLLQFPLLCSILKLLSPEGRKGSAYDSSEYLQEKIYFPRRKLNVNTSSFVFRFQILRQVISMNVFRGFPRFTANVPFIPKFQATLHDYHATFLPNTTTALLNLSAPVQRPQIWRVTVVLFTLALTCFYRKVEWAISGCLQSCKLSCFIGRNLISITFR